MDSDENKKKSRMLKKPPNNLPRKNISTIPDAEQKYLNGIELSRESYKRLFNEGIELIKREQFPRSLLLEILDEYADRLAEIPEIDLDPDELQSQDDAVKEKIKSLILFGSQAVLISDNARLINELNMATVNYQELLQIITHEFKNILTSMHGYYGILKRQSTRGKENDISDVVTALERLTRKMFNMVDSLLKMSLGEKKMLRPDRKLIDFMTDVVEPVVNEVKGLLQQKGMRLKLPGRKKPKMLMGDEELLQSVIRNLLDNAIKYGESNSEITIRTRLKNDRLRVSVTNQGPGVPEEIKDHLFEKFIRSRVGNMRGGTGLGLYNIKNIIECHDGTISCRSGGNGTVTFTFELPQQL